MTKKSYGSLWSRSRTWLVRDVALRLGGLAMGHPMVPRLRLLEQAQWWEPERVQSERDRLLGETVRTAYAEVPFYRSLMDGVGVKPADVRRPEDLQLLPVVTKDLLRAGYPDQTCRNTGQRTYEVSTSGSTGANFRVREDNTTAGWYRATFLLALAWSGWQIGDPHLQTGMTLHRGLAKKLKDMVLGCYYVSAFDLSDAQLDRSLELLERKRLRYLWGYPGSIYYLARRASEAGWNRPLTSVVTWGDNLVPHYRRTIEAAFRTRVFDTYGCAEGVQISAQCGEGNSYHVHDLDVVVEFADGSGRPVPAGQSGDILLTRLHAGPMPLIRYRVGDVGSNGTRQRCQCGRSFGVMSAPQGRDTDVVVTPNGNRLIVHFFTGVLEFFPEIRCFQVVQETAEHLVVRVVPVGEVSMSLQQRVTAALQEKGATDMRIEVEPVSEIPLTSGGKRRFVINRTQLPQSSRRKDPPD